MSEAFDVIVVGGGHGGAEAALAAARMGGRTLLITMAIDQIAQMSCNPAIGGLAKGQLVREIDALGGEMGKVADATGIQFRMLNTGKGPAVQSPRCQSDRAAYAATMRRRLELTPNLNILQTMVEDILIKDGVAVGVRCFGEMEISARAVILTTGTFLNGLIHIGPAQTPGGRMGEPSAAELSRSLAEHGIELGRLKTGTPPRVAGKSLPLDKLTPQHGDKNPVPFSYTTTELPGPQMPCYITHTNARTHEIIRANLDRAPMYTGQITGTGARYCPSLEDKIVRFSDKQSHTVFLEPEGRDTDEFYCNGIPTSVPIDVQDEFVRSIEGMENAHITRYGYAIEYDFVPPTQLWPSLETKLVANLFHAGQINGTSGYEEAAAQGLMAGVNAMLKIREEEPFVLQRDEAYIGVLIDDLVTLGTQEPYRMFTSRAEFRLLLRHDNADRRLTPHGHRLGLVDDARFAALEEKEKHIGEVRTYMESTRYQGAELSRIMRRPEMDFAAISALDKGLADMNAPADVAEQVQVELKYEGYLRRQESHVARMRQMESWHIPEDLDYGVLSTLRNESQKKLAAIRPLTLGQASRISGVTPADISVLMVQLEARRRSGGS
jgi:tRNA uridine 5-carboxymethylaminomethyl modification enzyme